MAYQREGASRSKPPIHMDCTFFLDGEEKHCTLTFKSVKHFRLRVGRDASISLSLPHGATRRQAEHFLTQHTDFLRRALADCACIRPIDRSPDEQSCADGSKLLVTGKRIILRYCDDGRQPSHGAYVDITAEPAADDAAEEIWCIRVRRGLTSEQRCVAVKKAVISRETQYLRACVEQMLPRLCAALCAAVREEWGRKYGRNGKAEEISREMGLTQEQLRVFPNAVYVLPNAPLTLRFCDMKSRWGSCAVTKGVVNINTRLIFASVDCLEYVLCHELCHFFYANHATNFYALLSTVLPDAALRRAQLRG